MRTRILKCEDGLVIRIPPPVAKVLGIDANAPVEVEVVGRKIVVTPIRRHLTLSEMVEGMTEENLHGEVD